MYCRKCGNKMEEGDRFCGKCGADQTEKVEEAKEEKTVEVVEEKPVEDKEELEVEEINFSEVKTAYGVDGEKIKDTAKDVGNKAKDLVDKGVKYFKGLHRNNQIIIGVLVAVLLMFFVSAVYGGDFSRGGKNNSPEAAVKSMFTSIYKGDAKGLLKVISPSELYEIREEAGYDADLIHGMVEMGIGVISNELSSTLGNDWLKDLKILGTKQYSDSEFGVNVGMYGDITEVLVYKIDGKYYVDLDSMY